MPGLGGRTTAVGHIGCDIAVLLYPLLEEGRPLGQRSSKLTSSGHVFAVRVL
jgi:hypothetical protein